MKCQIARGVRVHITKQEYDFVQNIADKVPFILEKLPIEQQAVAKRLADKTIFVRKKLAHTTQCNLNKNIHFIY